MGGKRKKIEKARIEDNDFRIVYILGISFILIALIFISIANPNIDNHDSSDMTLQPKWIIPGKEYSTAIEAQNAVGFSVFVPTRIPDNMLYTMIRAEEPNPNIGYAGCVWIIYSSEPLGERIDGREIIEKGGIILVEFPPLPPPDVDAPYSLSDPDSWFEWESGGNPDRKILINNSPGYILEAEHRNDLIWLVDGVRLDLISSKLDPEGLLTFAESTQPALLITPPY